MGEILLSIVGGGLIGTFLSFTPVPLLPIFYVRGFREFRGLGLAAYAVGNLPFGALPLVLVLGQMAENIWAGLSCAAGMYWMFWSTPFTSNHTETPVQRRTLDALPGSRPEAAYWSVLFSIAAVALSAVLLIGWSWRLSALYAIPTLFCGYFGLRAFARCRREICQGIVLLALSGVVLGLPFLVIHSIGDSYNSG